MGFVYLKNGRTNGKHGRTNGKHVIRYLNRFQTGLRK